MSGQFFCKNAGGAVQVYLMEGAYSDEQIERWLAKGIIEVVD